MSLVPGSTDGPRPVPPPAPPSGETVLLAAERTVAVTREEHHQDVLAGRSGPVVVGLRPCTIGAGKYAGERGVEVGLDGRRVGELTRQMSRRYLPLIDALAARGRRAGCEAQLRLDHRGVQVELRLPAVDDDRVDPVTVPVPRPAPTGVLPRYPSPGAGPVVAGPPRHAPTAVGPVPPAPHLAPPGRAFPRRPVPPPSSPPTAVVPPPGPGPGGRWARPGRRAVWAGAAVVGVLTLVSAIGNGGRTDATAAAAKAEPASASAAVNPAVPTATPAAEAPGTGGAAALAGVTSSTAVPAARRSATARPVAPPDPATRARTTAERPAPRTPAADPPPSRRAAERAQPPEAGGSGCNANYSPCVPVASDVDCAGGSGNGPKYVRGPVSVIGSDEYGLDNDHDGIACE
ncbi:MAG TPA: hypothetical protein VF667_09525 [Pseudonocardia sp.]